MAGPVLRSNGIYYYRREIPAEVWKDRGRLRSMGVLVGGKQLLKSLNTRDPKVAKVRYKDMDEAYEALWQSWRDAIVHGPRPLSEMNVHAIAGAVGADFLLAHRENPSLAPVHASEAPGDAGLPAEIEAEIASINKDEEASFKREILRWESADREERTKIVQAWASHPTFAVLAKVMDNAALVAGRAAITSLAPLVRSTLNEHGFGVVDPETAAKAAWRATVKLGEVRGILQRMATDGDYSGVAEWLEKIPPITKPVDATGHPTFDAIIDAEVKFRGQGKGAKPMPAKTEAKYKRIAKAFAAFRGKGGSIASTVRADELEGWKRRLLEDGRVGRRTIDGNIGTIKTIVGSWGRRHFKSALGKAVGEVSQVDGMDYVRKPSIDSALRLDEAAAILIAARSEREDIRKRWIPWLCAYSGLRIGEANQLSTEDFHWIEGHWFFEVTSSNKRSLKTTSARRTIPVHSALIAEGFMTFVEASPKGSLFKPGANSTIGRWVRETVGIKRAELSPNHGWRHLFEDLCRRYLLSDFARHYLTGRSTGSSADLYGRTHAMLPGLWEELEKIRPLSLTRRGS